MTQPQALLPCPFCGGSAQLRVDHEKHRRVIDMYYAEYWVECASCKSSSNVEFVNQTNTNIDELNQQAQQTVIGLWNSRNTK